MAPRPSAPAPARSSISAARPRRSRAARQRDPRADRYHLDGSSLPDGGPASVPLFAPFDLAEGAVPDPTDGARRVVVTLNRRVDVLEEERSHGRMTVAEYEVGRQLQAVFERSAGSLLGSVDWNASGGSDPSIARELRMLYGVMDAQLCRRLLGRIERVVGSAGADVLRGVLCTAGTLREFAASRGAHTAWGYRQVAHQFRWLLSEVERDFAARGSLADEVRAFQGELTGEETDRAGVVVPPGKGVVWGEAQSRHAPLLKRDALALRGRMAKPHDRVSPRARVVVPGGEA